MTSGQLIADTDLTFLSHINLSHLQDAIGQLITNRNSELATLQLCIEQFIFLHEVDDQLSNQLILMLVSGPVAGLYITILKVSQSSSSEFAALRDNLSTCIVLHTL